MKTLLYSILFFWLSLVLSSCSISKNHKATTYKVATHSTIKVASKQRQKHSSQNKKIIKILPLGDSITCASTQKLSYRYPLWKQLIDAGKYVEFIGSQTQKGNGSRTWTPYKGLEFPQKNEGHSGWRADQILNGLDTGEVGLNHWIKGYMPDIALIHLGTNDLYQSQTPESTRDEIEQIINKLRNKNPRIKIALASIIPMGTDRHVPQLNQLLVRLTQKLYTPYSPVISVDMYSGFNIYTHMQKDHIHPNMKGEEIMAKRWFRALMQKEFLGTDNRY